MEFNRRGANETPVTNSPHSNSTEQTLRGFLGSNMERSSAMGYMRPVTLFSNMKSLHEYSPMEIHQIIWREREKLKIREEIIERERQILEAIEREYEIQRESNGFLLSVSPAIVRLLSHSINGMSHEERFGTSSMLGCGELGKLVGTALEMERSQEMRISGVRCAPETSKEQERIIFLAKNKSDLGVKRQAESPPSSDVGELPSGGTGKKLKNAWICALCQVSATSELGLNEHLQGRKHKAKEAGLLKNKNKIGIGISDCQSSVQGLDVVGDSQPSDKIGQPLLLAGSNSTNPKQMNGEPKKERFRFWCDMCELGMNSEKVMQDHKSGTKHLARVQKVNRNSGAVPLAQMEQAADGLTDTGLGSTDVEKIVRNTADGVENFAGVEPGDHLAADEDVGDGNDWWNQFSVSV